MNGKRVGVGVAIVAAAGLLLYLGGKVVDEGSVQAFRDWISGFGAWAPAVFVLAYAVAVVAFIPGSPLTLVAGAVFGLVWGTVYAFAGATLGASAAFFVARYGARERVARWLARSPRLAAIDQAVAKEGGRMVALLRLSPAIPFNVLNYALGLTDVRFGPYLAACLAMLPGTLLYVYYGKVVGDVVAAAGGERQKSPWEWALLGVGLVATVVASVLIARRARRALPEIEKGTK